MLIYIVTCKNIYHNVVAGVFTTRVAAEKYAAKLTLQEKDAFEVQAWEPEE
jgi:hypothetical protein